ncbi:PD-(D/E)XK nuclease family transposase (macronuclear) [Tetrahymena thermophila SB210]|uniref:PD-(D/E)XK nuclease family transposase n=1 Tax=Tetrahymena thermophila (strain SB210) TaxID=312017 RepID=I7MEP9_TETTS|nr:PD-(D/E)XK nuclease family transposase [Tetrahymena thermophila SB210]EAR97336.1 PD-(D/E)XK nuclease family transposase [Tetrahymena thermophila SB210]|eukprot:XP_001017581.1 PD-(D/E)XK nuclease family transposase [Tetrahymena thermophila SB210]
MSYKEKAKKKHFFADPKEDQAFKFLFSDQVLLNDFINTLLNLENNQNNKFQLTNFQQYEPIYQKENRLIKCMVDVLCSAKNINVGLEMQGQNKKEFKARTQYYSSKLLINDVHDYHYNMKNTYMIILSKFDVYNQNTPELIYYELDTEQRFVQTNNQVEENYQKFKYINLNAFKKQEKQMREQNNQQKEKNQLYKQIQRNENNIQKKIDWLTFFCYCSYQTKVPDNMSEIIQRAYNAMDITGNPNDSLEKRLFIETYLLRQEQYDNTNKKIQNLEQSLVQSLQALQEKEMRNKIRQRKIIKLQVIQLKHYIQQNKLSQQFINEMLEEINQEQLDLIQQAIKEDQNIEDETLINYTMKLINNDNNIQ